MTTDNAKGWWEKAGIIISLLGVIVSLVFSIKSCSQSEDTLKKQEIQYQETKQQIEFEKLKSAARDWFADGEYDKSFEYYNKVHSLDPTDDEGHRKFLNMGKNLQTKKNGKTDAIINTFFERAKQLKPE